MHTPDWAEQARLSPADIAVFQSCLSDIYAAAADARRWKSTVERLTRFVQTDKVNIFYVNPAHQVSDGACSSLVESDRLRYLDEWANQDELVKRMLRLPSLQVSSTETLTQSQREKESLPVFEGFYEPQGYAFMAACHWPIANGWLAALSVQHGWHEGLINSKQVARVALLAPHLQQAFRLSERIGHLEATVASQDGFLERCRAAAILCDSSGRVISVNARAQQVLIRYPEVLRIRLSRLAAASPKANAVLQRLIADPRSMDNRHCAPLLCLHSYHSDDTVECVVQEYGHPEVGSTFPGESLRLVVLRWYGETLDMDARYLKQRLELTEVEADVLARLASGASLQLIADVRGSTHETIRSYIKNLCRKLGCHSQSQLVTRAWAASTISF